MTNPTQRASLACALQRNCPGVALLHTEKGLQAEIDAIRAKCIASRANYRRLQASSRALIAEADERLAGKRSSASSTSVALVLSVGQRGVRAGPVSE